MWQRLRQVLSFLITIKKQLNHFFSSLNFQRCVNKRNEHFPPFSSMKHWSLSQKMENEQSTYLNLGLLPEKFPKITIIIMLMDVKWTRITCSKNEWTISESILARRVEDLKWHGSCYLTSNSELNPQNLPRQIFFVSSFSVQTWNVETF